MLISLTLLIMGVITLFSLVLGGSLSGSIIGGGWGSTIDVNGSTTSLEFTGDQGLFAIDPTVATIAIFVVIIAMVAVLGITVLGSGLSSESIKTMLTCILYGAIWGILSILAMPLIIEIEIFGTVIYTVLLMGYIVGVIQNISGGDGE